MRPTSKRSTLLHSETPATTSAQAEVYYDSIAVSNCVNKAKGITENFVFDKLYDKMKFNSITTLTDDIPFAKKRLVTPTSVYSGLIDILGYEQVNDAATLDTALKGKDAWLCIDIAAGDLMTHVDLAIKNGLKRVVFGINLSGSETEASDLVFTKETELLAKSGIHYTLLKYSSLNLSKVGESKVPYRIVRGSLPLPQGKILSHEDLLRMFVEVIDLPKSFNNVYGVGPGTALDTEILVYMKSQGWPERVQIGLLMGDMMEKIEKSYEAEKNNTKSPAARDVAALPINSFSNK